MKKALFIAMSFAVLLASCSKDPQPSDMDGEYLVYTLHSDDVQDFSVYETFTVADSLLCIDGAAGHMELNDWYREVKSQYIESMEGMGYTYVDTGMSDSDQTVPVENAGADLGIQISYIISADYFVTGIPAGPWWGCYPFYWSPSFWGNWGAWYYSFPVTYSYSTHSLLTEMADISSPQGDDQVLPVVWNSFINGEIGGGRYDIDRFSRAIGQSFTQSPYLKR